MVYVSLLYIIYGDVLWGSLSSTELQTLQCLQNKALTIIESARFKDAWPKKWLNVENLIRFDRSVLVYKALNRLCPESLWNMFHSDHLYLITILEMTKTYIFQKQNLNYPRKDFNMLALGPEMIF